MQRNNINWAYMIFSWSRFCYWKKTERLRKEKLENFVWDSFQNENNVWRNCKQTSFKNKSPSLQVFQLPPRVFEIIEIVNTVPSSVTVNTDEVRSKVFLTTLFKEGNFEVWSKIFLFSTTAFTNIGYPMGIIWFKILL